MDAFDRELYPGSTIAGKGSRARNAERQRKNIICGFVKKKQLEDKKTIYLLYQKLIF